ncbi:MAG: SDR family NAD(P)-dependent oxidoreductase [Deltaproteobacteria bacterium]|nr:SDR family NAD(P)-dependent oxidoreductase [Deltaproteobacteria bacterium]
MTRYAGMVAWITGGGTGIGRSLALEFARGGGDVALSGRRRDRLDEVAAEVRALGRKALVLPCDVVDEAACEATVQAIVAELGRLDVAFANAGFGVSGPIAKLTAADWRRQLDVNVIGVVNTAKWSIPALTQSGGRLVLVSSVMGMVAMAGQGPYAASKFAVRAIGLTLAQELHGTGVSCTTVYPGFVESEIGQVGVDGTFDPNRKDKRPKKFMWTGDKAARVIWSAVMKRKREFVFTGHGKVATFLGKHAPGLVHFALTRDKAKKKAMSSSKLGG